VFDWTPVINWLRSLEATVTESVEQMCENTRARLRAILQADVMCKYVRASVYGAM
jgi:hypothetical protein